MNWKEFKEAVDKQMNEKGISEEEEIWYIDWPNSSSSDSVHVSIDDSSGVSISS